MKNQESKKKMLIGAFTFVMAFGMTNSITASSWRIGASTYKPHFTSISAAMSSDNVQDGDTLYLDPDYSLSSSTVTKAVTIVGTGSSGSSISGITLSAENCKVLGCWINGDVTMKSPNTTLERCYISGSTVDMNNQENSVIRSCYIYTSMTSTYGLTVSLLRNGNNSIIENSIISLHFGSSNNGRTTIPVLGSFKNCVIKNNLFLRNDAGSTYSDRHIGYVLGSCSDNCEITNNIIINRTSRTYCYSSISDCTMYHNLLSSSSDSLYPYNLFNQSYDGYNPANGQGYATDGGDCGPYGGSYPYVDNCRPFGHPYNTSLNVVVPELDGILKISSTTVIQKQ